MRCERSAHRKDHIRNTSSPHLVYPMIESRTPEELDLEIEELTRGTESFLFEPSRAASGDGTPNTLLPGMRVYDSGSRMYIIDLQGQAVPVMATKAERPHKKVKKFYHQPIPSGTHTSAKVLLQQHAEMMESVNYDTFMDLATSGRFGKWDTTLSIHNSSNSSRESRNSRETAGTRKSSRLSL